MRSLAIVASSVLVSWLWLEAGGVAQAQRIDVAQQLAAGKLRVVNRNVTPLKGDRSGVHVSEGNGPGVVWVEGTDFTQGTIEVDVKGRDLQQQSFVVIAFHRNDDKAYESVYLRPFNFRASDPARRENAVQYMTLPEFDWPILRKTFPSEFENPVDPSVGPTDWNALRAVVTAQRIQVFVGAVKSPTLDVRKLGSLDRGQIGLWVGNGSDGEFSNLRITPSK
jgi:hypothetical protein